jgi:hypothetical protein
LSPSGVAVSAAAAGGSRLEAATKVAAAS